MRKAAFANMSSRSLLGNVFGPTPPRVHICVSSKSLRGDLEFTLKKPKAEGYVRLLSVQYNPFQRYRIFHCVCFLLFLFFLQECLQCLYTENILKHTHRDEILRSTSTLYTHFRDNATYVTEQEIRANKAMGENS